MYLRQNIKNNFAEQTVFAITLKTLGNTLFFEVWTYYANIHFAYLTK